MNTHKNRPHLSIKYLLLGLITLALLLFISACNLPIGGSNLGIENQTAIAQTVSAHSALSPLGTNTPPPNPDSSANTQAPPLTPTITLTPTSEIPMVKVSVDTNCRSGPGDIYDYLGALLAGKEVEIIAKDPTNLFWYIHNPDDENEFCWAWGNYATTTGDTENLPVFTPPPSPTPSPTPTPSLDYTPSFSEAVLCVNKWAYVFKITNIGDIPVESWDAGVALNGAPQNGAAADAFTQYNGCNFPYSQNYLLAGESGHITDGYATTNPSGKNFSATITVCSENGLGGICKTKTINFVP